MSLYVSESIDNIYLYYLPYSRLFTRKVIFANLSNLSPDRNVNRRKIREARYGAYNGYVRMRV